MGKKKKGKNYFDARDYVNRLIEQRTIAGLKEKNKQFAVDHAQDTKEQLLEYLRQMAQELGKTPAQNEIIGGGYIGYRFGSYINAVVAAGLPKPKTAPSPEKRKIYKDEQKLQAWLYKQEKADAKVQKAAVQQERDRIAQERAAERKERDALWAQEHRDDTDDELLAYVRECAETLGYSPYSKQVVGSSYIEKRFGGWTMTLYCAGLPMAHGMKPPTVEQLVQYRTRQNRCQPGNAPEAYTIE